MKRGTGPLRDVTYTVILPRGPEPRQTVQMSTYPSLAEIKSITGPAGIGYLEHYQVLHEDKLCDLVIDEEGKLKGFEPNEWATSVWTIGSRERRATVKILGERLCGPAVLFHDRVFVDDPDLD